MKELEKAKEILKYFITEYDEEEVSYRQVEQAIETVLNYIENSIPKEKVEKKIEEINKDLTENESYTTHWEITRNKYFEQQGKKAGFKELLEGK